MQRLSKAMSILTTRAFGICTAFIIFGFLLSMASANANHQVVEQILEQIKRIHQLERNNRQELHLPLVTVSFAQSLDGKLAPLKDSSESDTLANFPLSGDESLRLTHAIRSMHDGILIGGNTLSLDNPRLTNRLWNSHPDGPQPIPIVLDTHLNHLSKLKDTLQAQNLIVCCSEEAADSLESLPEPVLICPCPCGPDGRIDLRRALSILYQDHGIKSLMIEGGAQVVSSFFEDDLVDALCITIAPKLISRGIAPQYGSRVLDLTSRSIVHRLGSDSIVLSSMRQPILSDNDS